MYCVIKNNLVTGCEEEIDVGHIGISLVQLVMPCIKSCFQSKCAYIIKPQPMFSLDASSSGARISTSHDTTCDLRRRLGAQIQMSGQRILRKFPFSLNLGTDICHVTRIRKILESSRGSRFVQRILNVEERRHPKIQCILNNDKSPSMVQPAKSPGPMVKHHTGSAAAEGKDHSPSAATTSLEELQIAATFMAGRYDQPISSGNA